MHVINKESYKIAIKNNEKEEYLDTYFFRPMAYIIVKLFYQLPLNPNHYSFFALVSGIASAIALSKNYYLISIMLVILFCTFDCCDGMQARLKKNGSKNGKLIDGLVDYIVNIVLLSSYLIKLFQNKSTFLLIVLFFGAAVFKIFHSLLYDLYMENLPEYLPHAPSEKGILNTYLKMRIYLIKWLPKKSSNLFKLVGPTTHLILFIIAATLQKSYFYSFYSLIFCNLVIYFNSIELTNPKV